MIKIYTDGSAVAVGKNKGLGGFGIVFVINDEVKKVAQQGFYNTKTGRMELMAVLTALKILKKSEKAMVHSDSMYVVNTFNKGWLKRWKKLNFKTCKNGDIMKQLDAVYNKFPAGNITFKHVKGHNGNIYNELSDSLANYKNFSEKERKKDQNN